VLRELVPAVHEANKRHPFLTRLVFLVAGALAMLSFAPFGLYPTAPLLLLPFLFASFQFSPRQAARCGFWYGFGLFLAGTYWLYISIHVFGEAPLWVAVVIMLGLVMIMGLYYGLAAWCIRKISAGNLRRFLVAAPAVWVAIEWLRGWFLSGFPWMSLGYGQIDSTLAGFAPLFGVYGVSMMVVICASALFVAVMSQHPQRWALGFLAFAPWIIGALIPGDWTKPAGPPVITTIVQGGVPQDQKWLKKQFGLTLELYRASLHDYPASELIVWPEVALPATIDQIEDYLLEVEREVVANKQSLLFGILERDFDSMRIYNSTVLLTGGDRQNYRKRLLVPFGEFFPVPSFIRRWMRMMNLPNSDLNAGDDRQPVLVMHNGTKLAVAICYEDAYGTEQLYALPEASILINVSNDAWFGDSIAPHQHLEIARMRALEVGRYVVRSTNNGVSAFIGPDGAILESGPQFEYLAMTRKVMPLDGTTPYARYGNWPIVLICLLLIAGLLIGRTRRP